jgi:thiol:disulfide interchange protein
MLGDNVKLLKVDVDDSNNAALLKLFKVGPIPTVVYLDRNGRITSTMIGQTNYINFVKGISAIVH